MAYDKPNYTQTPNLFFDRDLPEITSLAELKVTLAIMRNTAGWHKKKVEMDVPKLIGATGLSRQSVIDGIRLAVTRGTILREAKGRSFTYEANIVTVKNLDCSSEVSTVKILDQKVDSKDGVSLLVKERKKSPLTPQGEIKQAKPIRTERVLAPDDILDRFPELQQMYPIPNLKDRVKAWYHYRRGQPRNKLRTLEEWFQDIQFWMGNGNSGTGVTPHAYPRKQDPDRPIWMSAGPRK